MRVDVGVVTEQVFAPYVIYPVKKQFRLHGHSVFAHPAVAFLIPPPSVSVLFGRRAVARGGEGEVDRNNLEKFRIDKHVVAARLVYLHSVFGCCPLVPKRRESRE